MATRWYCVIHGDGFTAKLGPYENEIDAEAEAYEKVSVGIRHGNRIYPNRAIVFAEVVREGE